MFSLKNFKFFKIYNASDNEINILLSFYLLTIQYKIHIPTTCSNTDLNEIATRQSNVLVISEYDTSMFSISKV